MVGVVELEPPATGEIPAVAGTAERVRTPSADETLTKLYVLHYRSLVRLASLLLDDVGASEEIVQEAYIRVYERLQQVNDPLPYLRRTVVNLSRSALRHRQVVRRHAPLPPPDAPGADEGAYDAVARRDITEALRSLPRRQREAVVLRYFGDLSEAEVASIMGVTLGTVKSSCSRGLDALAAHLEAMP
jgi:RNA polymerase sigma-70 factor (sigma-E family)